MEALEMIKARFDQWRWGQISSNALRLHLQEDCSHQTVLALYEAVEKGIPYHYTRQHLEGLEKIYPEIKTMRLNAQADASAEMGETPFDKEGIEIARNGPFPTKVSRPVIGHGNGVKVEVTQESREECAKALLS
ncbi:MAG: hypothetical protein FWE31_05290 [Firmicutes bacterium]|nr:hypothetical protein [Bacillota bacterium]